MMKCVSGPTGHKMSKIKGRCKDDVPLYALPRLLKELLQLHIPNSVHACAELPEHLLNAPDSTHQGALRNDVHHVGFRSGCSTASSPCSEGLCLTGLPQHPDSRGAPTPKRLETHHKCRCDCWSAQCCPSCQQHKQLGPEQGELPAVAPPAAHSEQCSLRGPPAPGRRRIYEVCPERIHIVLYIDGQLALLGNLHHTGELTQQHTGGLACRVSGCCCPQLAPALHSDCATHPCTLLATVLQRQLAG